MQFSKWCQDLIYFQETIFERKFFSFIIYLSSGLEYLKIGKFLLQLITFFMVRKVAAGFWTRERKS